MSAGGALQAAIVVLLKADELLPELSVFDAPPVRRAEPHAVVEDPLLKAFDASGVTGRIGTVAIGWSDTGEIPTRLRVLMATAEDAVDTMPAGLRDAWRIGGIELARSRLVRVKDGWLGRSEWAVRMFRVN